jgi:hypothetical protein
VFDGTTSVGHASVDASGSWSLPVSGLAVRPHNFTATDTDANGTSAASAVYAVTVDAPTAPPPPPSSPPSSTTNLVINGGFETSDFTGWTTSGNVAQLSYGPQLFITGGAHSGQDAAGFGSVGSDGAISQNLTTVVGQSYTLDFWLANLAGGPNDFTAKIGGVTELHLVNAAAQPYTHYNFTFTATSTSTPLEFDFRQDPSEWRLDDVSVVQATGSAQTPPPLAPPAAPVIALFSPDTAPVDDGHTTATSITLSGTGKANSTVNVFDGTTSVGHASVDASGSWSLLANGLTVGPHSFTATDTDANGTSAASAIYAVTVDAPTTPPPSPSSASVIASGDFNSDGKSDFVLRDTNSHTSMWSVDAQGNFTTTDLGTVGSNWTILSDDHFVNASTTQMLTGSQTDGTMTLWWVANGALAGINLGQHWNNISFVDSANFVTAGQSDILVRNNVDNHMYVWWVGQNNKLSGIDLGAYWGNIEYKSHGDFNGDGTVDMLVRNNVDNHMYVWSVGQNNKLSGMDLGAYWGNIDLIATGQFTSNGGTNMLVRNNVDNHMYDWWVDHNTNTLQGIDLGPNWANIQFLASGNFRGDGNSEMLVRNANDHHVYEWWVDQSSGKLQGIDLGAVDPNWQVQSTGNYNGDSYTDVLWHNIADGKMVVQFNGAQTPLHLNDLFFA